MKIKVELEEQDICHLIIMTRMVRRTKIEDEAIEKSLRDIEMTLNGALRSHGWLPTPEGGWTLHAKAPGRRF